jgi:hypothetical protein
MDQDTVSTWLEHHGGSRGCLVDGVRIGGRGCGHHHVHDWRALEYLESAFPRFDLDEPRFVIDRFEYLDYLGWFGYLD